MEQNNQVEALNAIVEAIKEVKAQVNDLDTKITDINITLERQGLKDWEAGATVNKTYCQLSHDNLTCSVSDSIKEFKKEVTSKIVASWIVLVLILSGYGALLILVLQKVGGVG